MGHMGKAPPEGFLHRLKICIGMGNAEGDPLFLGKLRKFLCAVDLRGNAPALDMPPGTLPDTAIFYRIKVTDVLRLLCTCLGR